MTGSREKRNAPFWDRWPQTRNWVNARAQILDLIVALQAQFGCTLARTGSSP
jgi:hypothetical protein